MAKRKDAFTILEILIVILILALIVTFGLPGFFKSINRTKARDAKLNLNLIHAANAFNRQRTGTNISTGTDLNAINAALGISILPKGSTYVCTDGLTCVATGPGGVFVATLTLNSSLSSSNPTCPQSICP